MTVESASYISQLDPNFPESNKAVAEGDDHLRLLKTVLQTQFSSLGAAAVTATAGDLNNIGWKFISATTASGATFLDVETTFDSTYDAYCIVINGLNVDGAGTGQLGLRLKVG